MDERSKKYYREEARHWGRLFWEKTQPLNNTARRELAWLSHCTYDDEQACVLPEALGHVDKDSPEMLALMQFLLFGARPTRRLIEAVTKFADRKTSIMMLVAAIMASKQRLLLLEKRQGDNPVITWQWLYDCHLQSQYVVEGTYQAAWPRQRVFKGLNSTTKIINLVEIPEAFSLS